MAASTAPTSSASTASRPARVAAQCLLHSWAHRRTDQRSVIRSGSPPSGTSLAGPGSACGRDLERPGHPAELVVLGAPRVSDVELPASGRPGRGAGRRPREERQAGRRTCTPRSRSVLEQLMLSWQPPPVNARPSTVDRGAALERPARRRARGRERRRTPMPGRPGTGPASVRAAPRPAATGIGSRGWDARQAGLVPAHVHSARATCGGGCRARRRCSVAEG